MAANGTGSPVFIDMTAETRQNDVFSSLEAILSAQIQSDV